MALPKVSAFWQNSIGGSYVKKFWLLKGQKEQRVSSYCAPLQLPLISLRRDISSSSFLSSCGLFVFTFNYFASRFSFCSTGSTVAVAVQLDESCWTADGRREGDRGTRYQCMSVTQENAARGNFLFRCGWTLQRSPATTGRCSARSSFLLLIKSGKSQAR